MGGSITSAELKVELKVTPRLGGERLDNVMTSEWRLLLSLLLSQRLKVNAIETALKSAQVLTDAQIKEIRKQASETAKAWSSDDRDDVLELIGVHSSPNATMLVPPTQEDLDFWLS
jgi:hypothetical protein